MSPGQLIIMGIPGPELTDSLRGFISRIQPGGFILFKRNLASPEQIFHLIAELRSLCHQNPVITIDQEGGRVSRLNSVTEMPPSGHELRLAGRTDWCHEHGMLTGQLLSLFGFNLDLAPVVDFSPDDNADNSLRGRCFGADVDEVISKAGAFLKGLHHSGVLGTIKHFPGYTFAGLDPHGELPQITRSRDEMKQTELKPFQTFASEAAAVMVGHGHFTAWHKESFPASLSPKIIQNLLREEMGYKGLVMTDDLEMGAIANKYGAEMSTRLAVEAGNDMLLICHNPACVEIAYDTLCSMPHATLEQALQNIAVLRQKLSAPPQQFDRDQFKKLSAATKQLREKVQAEIGNEISPEKISSPVQSM